MQSFVKYFKYFVWIYIRFI